MGQTVPSLSTGKVSSGLWYGSAGKANSEQTVQAFDQTLISMLLGNVKQEEGQVSTQLLALAGLQGASENAQEETADPLSSLVSGLLQDLPKLDDALQEDPSLLAALQGWLQSFQALTQPNASATGQQNNELSAATPEIPVLAQRPETIRFALQDALVQLLTAASSGQSTVLTDSKSQAGTLLEALQSLLQNLPEPTENKPTDNKSIKSKAIQQAITVFERAVQNSNNVSSETNGDSLGNNNPQTLLRGNQKLDAVQGKIADANASQFSEAGTVTEAKTTDDDGPLQAGNVVTAGQLVLRDNGTAPVKHVSQPIPVENFGKEMSGFLVSKLEIVKLHGMSEARISLFPEHLGQVDVKITVQGGQLVAQFVTEHAFAKESLEQQMAQLRSALQSQGLQVSKLEVTQNSSLSSHMYHDGRQPGSGNGQQQPSKRRTPIEDDALVINDLNEEWNEWVAEVRAKEQNYGSSFVAKA